MEVTQEWWQQATNVLPEDILDIMKTDPKIDEWRQSLIEELLEDRLVTALREESERLAAVQVAGILEKGGRWDVALQRDILQRVRREIKKSLVFQRFREQLKTRLNSTQVKEELKQLCTCCLVVKENSSSLKDVEYDAETANTSSCKEEAVGSNAIFTWGEEGFLENNTKAVLKPETFRELGNNENHVAEMESEEYKLKDSSFTKDSDNVAAPNFTKEEYFIENNFGENEEICINTENSTNNQSHSLETQVQRPDGSEISNSREMDMLMWSVPKQSKVTHKTQDIKDRELKNIELIDQGAIAQSLGSKMAGRRVKLLRKNLTNTR
ncbi:uncharacterized protein Gasu_12230 [Galdieria sulphuraria]|uniref:Uncharacterized protein n=1 Tax=Galdieria sulphuraria TaxID=130081 RepID=M2W6W2_GALSU|nr:uncharacterized protein Gasu_12230 [Galdieria sulphuraria]EME31551.1 hypothetical protein Gasu_12230 [Galdieria sulphuraria]|eukprot:XP_005708071.1 hypothetical protein Gasu_12230 [Galdieria sulphuraria]